jgi:hypothetical protein
MLQSALEQQLVDQCVLALWPVFLGGYRCLTRELAPPLGPIALTHSHAASVDGDIILYGRVIKKDLADRDRDSGGRSRGIVKFIHPNYKC